MKRNCLAVILLTSFMLLLSLSAYAASGDITLRFNGGGANDQVYTGETNTLEFMVTNDNPLLGMSLGFGLSNTSPATYTVVTPYGNKPGVPGPVPPKYIQEYGDALGAFDLGGLQFTSTSLPGSFLLGGAALGVPLPAHASATKLWDMKISVTADPGNYPAAFCIDNIFFPPAGSWTMDMGPSGGGSLAPTYFGNSNASQGNPDAPAHCWDVLKRPCVPPVFTSTPAAAVSKNHCQTYTFTFVANEGGNNPSANPVTYTSNVGTIGSSSGVFSIDGPATCGSTNVEVTAHNACQGTTMYPFTITWTNNNPTISNCPPSGSQKVGMGNSLTYQFVWIEPDPCDGSVWSVTQTCGPDATGRFSVSGTGLFNFNTLNPADGDSTFCFCVRVTDPCGGFAECCFNVKVLKTQPFVIKIEKTHGTFQGMYEFVSITKMGGSECMGGFDFLIAYDNSAISFFSADLGAATGPAGCKWEYFTYRFGAFGNCGGPCPSGYLRLVAIADVNNGANHPACYCVPDGGELAVLKFYVTNDRNFNCQYVPIRFAWVDCGDNGISSVTGDTLFISDRVFDFQNTNPLTDPSWDLTGLDCGYPFRYGGACPECNVSQKYHPVPFILFWNGGIDIVCSDSIDARGDLNLNGIRNEIADAVLFTNYFLYGVSALDPNPTYRAGQIAASDVNADGNPLTVGDLVYLLRVIVGDALPYPKLAPFANTVNVTMVDGVISTEASTEIGAVYATFAVNGTYSVVSHTDMQVVSAESNGELHVLVYSGMENMKNRLAAGNNDLFAVNGNVELKHIEAADYNGSMLTSHVSKALPTSYALLQNTPNPFNPTTKIGLNLPTVSDWSLNIYNVAGQLVKSFNGRGVGNVTVDVDASKMASGIYFYKATAGSFSDTKKMVLMK